MAAKKQSTKCTIIIRNLSLDRFRLPGDGRKWKQAARSRSELLVRLSTYANGDGTFVRNGKNYSPSFETMEKHVARKSFYRITDALRDAGLLSWIREKHYERRVYTIHLPETGVTFEGKQVSDSQITGVTLAAGDQEQVSDSPEQVSHSPKTGVTMGHYPSLPSKEPSTPTTPSQPKTKIAGVAAGENFPNKNQQLPQKSTACESEALTEQSVIDAIQETYFAKLDEPISVGGINVGYPEDIGVPRALNTAGSRELFGRLVQEFGVTRAELDNGVVAEAFGNWFDDMYLPGFKDKWETERRNRSAEENNGLQERVPQPIKCPLAVFCKGMKIHIDATRKYRREKAEEQASS
jgi:hypothetical protein